MKWTFDALLPPEQRFTSLRFRRVSRHFQAGRLDWGEAAELCAFVLTVGLNAAQKIFHWNAYGRFEMRRLLAHMGEHPDVLAMVEDNHASVRREDGLKCLSAMRDGGWKAGPVPRCVRLALLDMRDAGMTQREIGEQTGLTRDQVAHMTTGRRPRAVGLGVAGLVAG